jgi:hypothetical protein
MMKKKGSSLPVTGRLYVGRDVVECPECGEPEAFLGLFLRMGRGPATRLWRLEWVTHAPSGFARWVQKSCPRWRRAREIYVNHCSSCGAPLADPLGFQTAGGRLCDTGIDVAALSKGKSLDVAGFSPGAVVLPEGHGLWEESLRVTVRDFRRHYRDLPRFLAHDARLDRTLLLIPAVAPHRWRLTEQTSRGHRPSVDESFFSFPQAKRAAAVRWSVRPSVWRAE